MLRLIQHKKHMKETSPSGTDEWTEHIGATDNYSRYNCLLQLRLVFFFIFI